MGAGSGREGTGGGEVNRRGEWGSERGNWKRRLREGSGPRWERGVGEREPGEGKGLGEGSGGVRERNERGN